MSSKHRFRYFPHGRRAKGFTLIELMIVVGIVAVLAAMAYANYTNSVINSRRKAAAACLLEGSQFMERFYTTRLTYAAPPNPLPIACRNELADFYTIAINGTPTATGYVLNATPLGQQLSKDTLCGTLGINQAGTRTKTGTGIVGECW